MVKHCCHVVFNMTTIYHELDILCEIYKLFLDPSESESVDDSEIAAVRRRLYLIGERAANLLLNTYDPCATCIENISIYYYKYVLLTAKMCSVVE